MAHLQEKVKEVIYWVDHHPRLGWYLFILTLLQLLNLMISTANLLA